MLAAGFGVLATVTVQFIAEPIVALFTDPSTANGAEVVRFGGQYLRGYIFDCIFAGIHFSFSGYFCACGKSGLSFLHNMERSNLFPIGEVSRLFHISVSVLPAGSSGWMLR